MEPSNTTYSLDKLKQYVGDNPQQIKEMLQLFLDTVPEDIEQLVVLSKNEDWFELYKVAHRIKPTFEVFAMDQMFNRIKEIETIALNNNIDNSVQVRVKKFYELFQIVKEKIENELSVIN